MPLFDIKGTVAAMIDAANTIVASRDARVRACVRDAIGAEKDFLEALAQSRVDGELSDEELVRQLSDERRTIGESLVICPEINTRTADDAAGVAIDAFTAAVRGFVAPPAGPTRRGRAARARPPARRGKLKAADRRLNARPDTVDFRDLMYVPTLVEVGTEIPLAQYLKAGVPVLDQGTEGACTGFGLATVANYLLRSRKVVRDPTAVSPRMLYAMARRYDEWAGEAYDGSSCRGAMKGWHKHGVCSRTLWEHDPAKPDNALTDKRAADAQGRPLGAYFRVNHKDLVAMHAAISEVGILYASASVHSGWDDVTANGRITFDGDVAMLGGHAFALVAYDNEGFWLQNSWNTDWGKKGFGHISYEDWLANGTDTWVARLGVPTTAMSRVAAAKMSFVASSQARSGAVQDVRPHVVSLGNDGALRPNGNIGTTEEQLRQTIHSELPRMTAQWTKRRIVLYAHGGLVGEEGAVQRVAEYREAMLDAQCYPLAFIWHSDYLSTLKNILGEALRQRRPEGAIEGAKDFLLDRLDDALEPLARQLTGKASWGEMKENALLATDSARGGARFVAGELAKLAATDPKVEFHLVGHSAGSILHAPLIRLMTQPKGSGGLGLTIQTCTLWAPAITTDLFAQTYVPAIESGAIKRFALYTLTDKAERDDNCARVYNKSLLYLVSHAFEKRARIPLFRPNGEPLLGMAKFANDDKDVKRLRSKKLIEWILSPNDKPVGDSEGAGSTSHGGFDDDKATVLSTLSRIVGKKQVSGAAKAALSFSSGTRTTSRKRAELNEQVLGAR